VAAACVVTSSTGSPGVVSLSRRIPTGLPSRRTGCHLQHMAQAQDEYNEYITEPERSKMIPATQWLPQALYR
jgi:hypothetical protein